MSITVTRTLEVRCLGTFGVYDGGRRLGPWSSRRAKALLKHLVLHRHRPVPREVLMEAFWPDAWPAAARNNLHGAVHALRRFLREVHGDVEHVVFEDGCYSLAPELELWDDVSEFERLAREARRCAPDAALPLLEAADELYAGGLFDDDPYEEWMQPRRRELEARPSRGPRPAPRAPSRRGRAARMGRGRAAHRGRRAVARGGPARAHDVLRPAGPAQPRAAPVPGVRRRAALGAGRDALGRTRWRSSTASGGGTSSSAHAASTG